MNPQENIATEIAEWNVQPIAGRIGAQINGVKVGGALPPTAVKAIRQYLLKYKVLFFRAQHHLTLTDLEAFGKLFGELAPHPTIPKIEGTESALKIVYEDATHAANEWHTDESFMDTYHMAGILQAITLPSIGGDTMWANTAAAYQALPGPLQRLAGQLWGFHSNMSAYNAARRHPTAVTTIYECEQPVVHVHPETSEHALLLGFHTQHLLNFNRSDSARLIAILQDHIARPENTVRWHWSLGDVAFWDNRATQHYGLGDFTSKRELNRISLRGEPAVSVDGKPSVLRRKEKWRRSPAAANNG